MLGFNIENIFKKNAAPIERNVSEQGDGKAKKNPLASEETLVKLEEARKKSQEEMKAHDERKRSEREEENHDLAA